MEEEAREEKRPAVKSRKADEQGAKGTRRKQRTGTGPRSADRNYGTRNVRKLHHGPAISITVQLPSMRRKKPVAKKYGSAAVPTRKKDAARTAGATAQHHADRPKQRLFVRPVLALLVIAAVGAVFYFYPSDSGSKKPAETAAAAVRTEPDYQPLLPSAESATASTYDGKRNMVSYNVSFSGARLTVSQQALPANFATDPSAIMKAADSIKATEQIETAKGMLYVATNEEAGDQLAVIADKHVLVFVHANRKLDEITWRSFIDLLEAKSWEKVQS